MPDIKHHFRKGRMNKDLDERLVPNGEYRDAQNIEIITSEGSGVGSVQNVLGNTLKDGKVYDENSKALTLWGSNSSSIKDHPFGRQKAMLDLGLLETFNDMTSFPSDDKVLQAAGVSVEEYKKMVNTL